MIQEYTRRSLTVPTDVLFALTGLATATANVQSPPLTYTNGLWAEDIQRGLAWYVEEGESGVSDNTARVPSWSWASQWGSKIKYGPYLDSKLDGLMAYKDLQLISDGSVDGKLRLKGWLRSVRVLSSKRAIASALPRMYFLGSKALGYDIVGLHSDGAIGIALLDSAHDLDSFPQDVVCLLLTKCRDLVGGGWHHLVCLALVPIDAPSCYRRVGLALFGDPDTFASLTTCPSGSLQKPLHNDSAYEAVIEII